MATGSLHRRFDTDFAAIECESFKTRWPIQMISKYIVSWKPNDIWYQICLAEFLLSKNPSDLLGYRHLVFKRLVSFDELPSSEESGIDAGNVSKASGSNSKQHYFKTSSERFTSENF